MKIIVPIAGRGSRFQAIADQNPEYQKPKPLINVKGKPMVCWAVESLPFVDLPFRPAKTEFKVTPRDLIFVALSDHETNHSISQKLKASFSNAITVVVIPDVTRGALETVLTAKAHLPLEEDLIISDSDHFFDGTPLMEMINKKSDKVAGIIPVFTPPDDEVKWSYTLFDKDKTALAVGEKDPKLAAKGASANIGAYYFSKIKTLIAEAEEMIKAGETFGAPGKEEFYVAPLYQRMIKKGYIIQAAPTKEVWGLGTPKDLEYFLANYKG